MINFYPKLSIFEIPNEGEKFVYFKLEQELQNDKEEWHVFYSYNIAKHINQAEGECDFIVLNKRGLLVLEVKNGRIALENGQFYFAEYRKNNKLIYPKKKIKNPFVQAKNNAYSLLNEFKSRKIDNLLCCYGVVFPISRFDYYGIEYNQNYIYSLSSKSNSFKDFILNAFDYWRNQKKWEGYLSESDIKKILNIMRPYIYSPDEISKIESQYITTQFLEAENVKIVEGLKENPRIMIQGPPGSGKSTYAMAYIERESGINNKKGLYICWNKLLSSYIQNEIEQRELSSNIQVFTYYSYIKYLLELSKINKKIDFNSSNEDYYDALLLAISKLNSENTTPKYDFIILDEGQDVMKKGLDILLSNLTNNIQDIQYSNYFLLYDIDQAYDKDFQENLDYLKLYSAHYTLLENHRNKSAKGIIKFSNDIYKGAFNTDINYGNEVEIILYKENIVKELINFYNKKIIPKVHKPNEIVLLLNSNILNDLTKYSLDFASNIFEELNEDNLTQPKQRLYYTSSLKFKGLERKQVVLVIDEIDNLHYRYESMIGASRAISKLYVLLKND